MAALSRRVLFFVRNLGSEQHGNPAGSLTGRISRLAVAQGGMGILPMNTDRLAVRFDFTGGTPVPLATPSAIDRQLGDAPGKWPGVTLIAVRPQQRSFASCMARPAHCILTDIP